MSDTETERHDTSAPEATKRGRFPESLVLILALVLLAQLATLVLPAGSYERDDGRVIPGTYALVDGAEAEDESSVARKLLWVAPTVLTSVPRGLEKGADVIFFVFLIGGVIAIIRRTGAIDALLAAAIARLGGRPTLLVAGMTLLLAVGSSTVGMAEEYMPFVPILVTMAIAMRMDAIVAMGIIYIGAGIGYGCAALNPFTVMIGQDIAGLQPGSGAWLRWLLLGVCTAIGVHHILRYATRIQKDPSLSLVREIDYSGGFEMPQDTKLTFGRGAVLLASLAAISIFVWGAKVHEWYLTELAALFLALGLVAAIFGRLSPNETSRTFCRGAAEMTTTALLIGFARTIELVLTDAQVIDTVIHSIAQPLQAAGSEIAVLGMLGCLLYTSPSPRDQRGSRMPSSA